MVKNIKDKSYYLNRELRKLLSNSSLGSGISSEGFDGVSKKLLDRLQRGASIDKLYDVLESELIVSIGLCYPDTSEIENLTRDIYDWWEDSC